MVVEARVEERVAATVAEDRAVVRGAVGMAAEERVVARAADTTVVAVQVAVLEVVGMPLRRPVEPMRRTQSPCPV